MIYRSYYLRLFGSEGSFRYSSLRSDWRQKCIFADLSHSTQWRFASWFVKTAFADAAKSALWRNRNNANEIIENWKDVVKAHTDLYNKTHRGCELKNVFQGFIAGVDEAPLPADDESVSCMVEEVEKMMRRSIIGVCAVSFSIVKPWVVFLKKIVIWSIVDGLILHSFLGSRWICRLYRLLCTMSTSYGAPTYSWFSGAHLVYCWTPFLWDSTPWGSLSTTYQRETIPWHDMKHESSWLVQEGTLSWLITNSIELGSTWKITPLSKCS